PSPSTTSPASAPSISGTLQPDRPDRIPASRRPFRPGTNLAQPAGVVPSASMDRREPPSTSGAAAGTPSGRARHARTFEAIRPEVVVRLVHLRVTTDHTLSSVPSHPIRKQFDSLLDRMSSYLADHDVARYRAFAARWVAFRLGEGFSPENLIHSMVAIGDVVLEVAKRSLPPGLETAEFLREVARVNFVAARIIVEILAGEQIGRAHV